MLVLDDVFVNFVQKWAERFPRRIATTSELYDLACSLPGFIFPTDDEHGQRTSFGWWMKKNDKLFVSGFTIRRMGKCGGGHRWVLTLEHPSS